MTEGTKRKQSGNTSTWQENMLKPEDTLQTLQIKRAALSHVLKVMESDYCKRDDHIAHLA